MLIADMNNNPDNIRKFIFEHGFDSIQGFSKSCDIHVIQMREFISGKKKPSPKHMAKIASSLKEPFELVVGVFYYNDLAKVNRHIFGGRMFNNRRGKAIPISIGGRECNELK